MRIVRHHDLVREEGEAPEDLPVYTTDPTDTLRVWASGGVQIQGKAIGTIFSAAAMTVLFGGISAVAKFVLGLDSETAAAIGLLATSGTATTAYAVRRSDHAKRNSQQLPRRPRH